jgi:hypothetical protein
MLHDPAAERLAPLLSQLENFERSRPDKQLWDLANAKALLAPIGAAPQHGKAVQVGGSKGKGTVCAFLGAFGQAAGLRTGAYLSPHVVTILERILLDGRQISVDAMEKQLRLVLARAGQLLLQRGRMARVQPAQTRRIGGTRRLEGTLDAQEAHLRMVVHAGQYFVLERFAVELLDETEARPVIAGKEGDTDLMGAGLYRHLHVEVAFAAFATAAAEIGVLEQMQAFAVDAQLQLFPGDESAYAQILQHEGIEAVRRERVAHAHTAAGSVRLTGQLHGLG